MGHWEKDCSGQCCLKKTKLNPKSQAKRNDMDNISKNERRIIRGQQPNPNKLKTEFIADCMELVFV